MRGREIVSSRKFAESCWLVKSSNGMEVNSSLSSSLNIAVGGAGAWPLADRRVSMPMHLYLQESMLKGMK